MNKFIYIIIGCLLLSGYNVSAQEAEQGEVTIHSDPRLGILLKKSRLLASAAIPAHPADAATIKPTANTAQPPLVHQSVTPLQQREIKTIYTGKGYRVQIYNGPDRDKAMSVKTDFMRRFPGVRTYLIYNSPAFRVRIGDYRNRSDAEGMLREANSMFSPSMIVPDVVTISTY